MQNMWLSKVVQELLYIHEPVKFNHCKHDKRRTVNVFATNLYWRTEHFNYWPLHDEQDRTVVGIRDGIWWSSTSVVFLHWSQAQHSKSVKK